MFTAHSGSVVPPVELVSTWRMEWLAAIQYVGSGRLSSTGWKEEEEGKWTIVEFGLGLGVRWASNKANWMDEEKWVS